MCDCHARSKEQEEAICATEQEPNTIEDWRELHDLIETYRNRRAARHVYCHVDRHDDAVATVVPIDEYMDSWSRVEKIRKDCGIK